MSLKSYFEAPNWYGSAVLGVLGGGIGAGLVCVLALKKVDAAWVSAGPSMGTWLSVITAVGTAMAGVAAWGAVKVATRQHEMQRQQLRLDLFDKRLKVAQALGKLTVSCIAQDPKVTTADMIEFLGGTGGALYLFEKPVTDYLDLVKQKAEALIAEGRHGASHNPRENELVSWFVDQPPRMRELLEPYFSFRGV